MWASLDECSVETLVSTRSVVSTPHPPPRARAWRGDRRKEGILVRFLGVHPGPLLYSRIFLRLEPLGLDLLAQAPRRAGEATRLIDLKVEDQPAYFRLLDSCRPDVVAFPCN